METRKKVTKVIHNTPNNTNEQSIDENIDNNNSDDIRDFCANFKHKLETSISKNIPHLQIPKLKLQACTDILNAIAFFLMEIESEQEYHKQNSTTSSPDWEWKHLAKYGYQIILESLDMESIARAYHRAIVVNDIGSNKKNKSALGASAPIHVKLSLDEQICQKCLQSILHEALPTLNSNEVRQILLDVLPHFLPPIPKKLSDKLGNKSLSSQPLSTTHSSSFHPLSIEETSKSILHSFQNILLSDSHALIPMIGCLSTINLSLYGKYQVYLVTLNSLKVVQDVDLPILVQTLLKHFITLDCAMNGLKALRMECLGLVQTSSKILTSYTLDNWQQQNFELINFDRSSEEGTLLLIGYILADKLWTNENDEDCPFCLFHDGTFWKNKNENHLGKKCLVREGMMQLLEQIISDQHFEKQKQTNNTKQEPEILLQSKREEWTAIDIIALLILFQINEYRERTEILLYRLIRHQSGFPFLDFHRFLDLMSVNSESNNYNDSIKQFQEQWKTNRHDTASKKESFSLGSNSNLFLTETILNSCFELMLWLLLIPCHRRQHLITESCRKNNILMHDIVSRTSNLIAHLCISQPTIEEDVIECLLSMSSLSFLEMGQTLPSLSSSRRKLSRDSGKRRYESKFLTNLLFEGKSKATNRSFFNMNTHRHNDTRIVANGIYLVSLMSVNTIVSITKIKPRSILPYHASILDRIHLESITDIPCASIPSHSDFHSNGFQRNKFIRRNSILMICPQIVHQFCHLVALLIESDQEINGTSNMEYYGYRQCLDKGEGLDLTSTLILIQKMLMIQNNNSFFTTKPSFAFPINNIGCIFRFNLLSFTQRQAVGIILATHLITLAQERLSNTDTNLLLNNVANLMLRNSRKRNILRLNRHDFSLRPYDHHPLVQIYGCQFFFTVATTSTLRNGNDSKNLATIAFRLIKNIVSSIDVVKLSSQFSLEQLSSTRSALAYENSFYAIYDSVSNKFSKANSSQDHDTFGLEQRKFLQSQREMVVSIQDYLDLGGWEDSFWWHPLIGHPLSKFNGNSLNHVDYNLRHCQAVYLFRLLDTYLDSGQKQSSNWNPIPWLLAPIQLPKWPSELTKLLQYPDNIVVNETNDVNEVEVDNNKEEEHEFDDNREMKDSAEIEKCSISYELWSLDIENLSKKWKTMALSCVLDPSVTDCLLKIGWSCAMALSACGAVLKNAFRSLNTPQSSSDKNYTICEENQYQRVCKCLLQYQLSKFYDLKIRGETCVQLLENIIRNDIAKVKQVRKKRRNKSLGPIMKSKRKGVVRRQSALKNKVHHNHHKRDLHNAKYLDTLNLERNFLSRCLQLQYDSLLEVRMIWYLLKIFFKDSHLRRYIEQDISLEKNHQPQPCSIKIQHSFNFLEFLLDHLSHMITFKKSHGKSSFEIENPINFCVSCVNVDDKLVCPLDFEGLGYVLQMTNVLAPWLTTLRKKNYEAKNTLQKSVFVSLSKATRLLASHYNLLLVALRYIRDEHNFTNSDHREIEGKTNWSSTLSKLPYYFIHFVNSCYESMCISNDVDGPRSSNENERKTTEFVALHRIELIFKHFESQLVIHCEDASLAAQLLDILSLLTYGLNKVQSTKALTLKVLNTIYVINPDMCVLNHDQRNEWNRRISNPPLSFSLFLHEQIETNAESPVVISSLRDLNNIVLCTHKTYAQSAILRHFLLTYLSLMQPKEYASQFRTLINYLRQMLEQFEQEKSKTSTINYQQHKSPIPGLTVSSYPVYFEVLMNMLVALIALSSPTVAKFKMDNSMNLGRLESPYINLQDLTEIFREMMNLFYRNYDHFPKRCLNTLIKTCFSTTQIIDFKIKTCVEWRNKQPIPTDEEKNAGLIDQASVAYLELLINDVALCTASIVDFCNAIMNKVNQNWATSLDTGKKMKTDKEYVNNDNVKGTLLNHGSNHKDLAMLHLKCEKLMISLRITCRQHNIIPPDLETVLKKAEFKLDKNNPSDLDELNMKKKKPKKRISLINTPFLETSICTSDEEDETRGERRMIGLSNTGFDEKNESVDSFSNDGMEDDDQISNDVSSTGSFGVIGEWGTE